MTTSGKTNIYTFHYAGKTQRLAVFQGTPSSEIEDVVRHSFGIDDSGERLIFLNSNGDRVVLSSWAPNNYQFFTQTTQLPLTSQPSPVITNTVHSPMPVMPTDSDIASVYDEDEEKNVPKKGTGMLDGKSILQLSVDFVHETQWSDTFCGGGKILDGDDRLKWKGEFCVPSYIFSTPFNLPKSSNSLKYIVVHLGLAYCCEATGLVAESVRKFPTRAHMEDDPRFKCTIANMAINYAKEKRTSKVDRQVSMVNSGKEFMLGIAITNSFVVYVDHKSASSPTCVAELPDQCVHSSQRIKLVAGHTKHAAVWTIERVTEIPKHAVFAVLAERKRRNNNNVVPVNED